MALTTSAIGFVVFRNSFATRHMQMLCLPLPTIHASGKYVEVVAAKKMMQPTAWTQRSRSAVALSLRPGSNPPSVKPGAYWLKWEDVHGDAGSAQGVWRAREDAY